MSQKNDYLCSMYKISQEQARNYWQYSTLSSSLELSFYLAIPRIMNGEENLFLDENAKKAAESLAQVINNINPPEKGESNKAVCIMTMAKAYVKYLSDVHNNDSFCNPGSFFLICTRIAKHVN